jgi:hypothetical protein
VKTRALSNFQRHKVIRIHIFLFYCSFLPKRRDLVGSPGPWMRIGPGRDISPDSSNEECLSLAKSWLYKCMTKHAECLSTPSGEDPLLPTRVIDVGDSVSAVRLVISNGKKAKYATLSHCWGLKPVSLITTEASLQDNLRSITLDASSKTFQQAAEVTRHLGLRYLWIDSLCIIQGSAIDWANEAARMSSVYSNATVCLSANAASDASQGIFPSQAERKDLNPVCKIQFPGPDGKQIAVRVRSL